MVDPMNENTAVALFVLSIVGSITVPILALLFWDFLCKKLKIKREKKTKE